MSVHRAYLFAALILAGIPTFAAAQANAPFEFHHDFRGKPLPEQLTPFQAEKGKFFREEPEGLRITIPETWIHPWGGIGFRTSFGLAGDFEVTTTIDILQADAPPQGYGVGFCLYVAKSNGGASCSRLLRSGGREVVLWDIARSEDKGPKVVEGTSPCTARTLRLRMKRSGRTLHYLWAPGTTGGMFEEFRKVDFGDEPVERVRLAALTGRQPCNLDIRLLDLHIRSQTSDGMPTAAVVAAAEGAIAPAPPAGRALWRMAAVAALLLAIAGGMLLAIRRGRREPAGK